ncbi:MAG: hypothetical protein K5668_11080 [Lachnospiraceae bacterium]|nr:hypothetical protein [Lachnospiraceae bacterium]
MPAGVKRFLDKAETYAVPVINAVLLIFACVGVYTSYFMNTAGRSFWLDEASLSISFSKRTLAGLFTEGGLEHNQSAPLGWLYIEKILSLLFGNNEAVLRTGSFAAFILVLVSLVFIQFFYFRSRFPFAAAAIVSNIEFVLKYSNMFKQYMFESFIALFICILFILLIKKKIPYPLFILLWMLSIWFAQIAAFVEGGLILSVLIYSFINKDRERIKQTVLSGVMITLSFIAYYFAWIHRMGSVGALQDYWDDKFFPLIPGSLSDIRLMLTLIQDIFKIFPDGSTVFIGIMCVLGIVYAVIKKDELISGIFLGFFVALSASFIHMFPISPRLCCYMYPLLVLISVVAFEWLFPEGSPKLILCGVIIIAVTAAGTGIKYYLNPLHGYIGGEELNTELDYLKSHIGADDKIYVYYGTKGAFEYKNGYDNPSFGDYENNVVMGSTYFDEDDERPEEEMKKVLSFDKCYIVSSHLSDGIYPLFDYLQDKGSLELISYEHQTPLMYFCRDNSDSKIDFTMNEENTENRNDMVHSVIHIENTGEAYLNSPYNDIFLEDTDNGKVYAIEDLIAPGESVDISVSYPSDKAAHFVLLSNHGRISGS